MTSQPVALPIAPRPQPQQWPWRAEWMWLAWDQAAPPADSDIERRAVLSAMDHLEKAA